MREYGAEKKNNTEKLKELLRCLEDGKVNTAQAILLEIAETVTRDRPLVYDMSDCLNRKNVWQIG